MASASVRFASGLSHGQEAAALSASHLHRIASKSKDGLFLLPHLRFVGRSAFAQPGPIAGQPRGLARSQGQSLPSPGEEPFILSHPFLTSNRPPPGGPPDLPSALVQLGRGSAGPFSSGRPG